MSNDNADLNLPPATIVIFGVTGDLSTRKLLPSLYELEKNGLLHPTTRILGITRRPVEISQLLKQTAAGVCAMDGQVSRKVLTALSAKLEMYQMNAAAAEDYPGLKAHLNKIEEASGVCGNRIYYLAIPPQVSQPIINHLGEYQLDQGCQRHGVKARLLMEKPFGFDVETAQELIAVTTKYFDEEQIYRIDHYLAKETVQNIITFRFRNPIFEDIWNSQHIQSIEISANEKLDIEGRAAFYEQTGAVRDLIQSHLLHVMSVVMMDRPADITSADDIHQGRLNVLESIEPPPADHLRDRAIRGQYQGYKAEVNNPHTFVETFAALKLYSRAGKWQGVPIIIRTGKALDSKSTCIAIRFKPSAADHNHTNELRFYIQPDESIAIDLWVKRPGFTRVLQTAPMSFHYQQVFDDTGHPTAYERVLVDAVRGDHTLFATSKEVLAAWRALEPVLRAWSLDESGLQIYKKGSAGPDIQSLWLPG